MNCNTALCEISVAENEKERPFWGALLLVKLAQVNSQPHGHDHVAIVVFVFSHRA